jgi:hypothetical protein
MFVHTNLNQILAQKVRTQSPQLHSFIRKAFAEMGGLFCFDMAHLYILWIKGSIAKVVGFDIIARKYL